MRLFGRTGRSKIAISVAGATAAVIRPTWSSVPTVATSPARAVHSWTRNWCEKIDTPLCFCLYRCICAFLFLFAHLCVYVIQSAVQEAFWTEKLLTRHLRKKIDYYNRMLTVVILVQSWLALLLLTLISPSDIVIVVYVDTDYRLKLLSYWLWLNWRWIPVYTDANWQNEDKMNKHVVLHGQGPVYSCCWWWCCCCPYCLRDGAGS